MKHKKAKSKSLIRVGKDLKGTEVITKQCNSSPERKIWNYRNGMDIFLTQSKKSVTEEVQLPLKFFGFHFLIMEV